MQRVVVCMGNVTKRPGRLELMNLRPRFQWKFRRVLVFLVVELLVQVGGAGVDKTLWNQDNRKLSGLIIPGFASTRLSAWAMLDCPYSPIDFSPLDPVWLDTRKVFSVLNCWLKCILLDPDTQADHPECKSRPDTGLSAITELDPGYITGPLSSVWREWVNWCVEFGIEPDAVVAAPYDWRLSGGLLQKRDLYFHKLKLLFETARLLRGGPSLVFAHSLGNNVFRYFLEWLKLEIAPKLYIQWLDDHVHAYFSVGTPFLGAVETIKAMLSGTTFGLPIAEGTARMMTNSFSSSQWMLPFSQHCHDRRHVSPWMRHLPKGGANFVCDEEELAGNASMSIWPVDIVTVDFPTAPGMSAYPEVQVGPESVSGYQQCSVPVQRTYSAHQVSDGTFLRDVSEFDPTCKKTLKNLHMHYLDDPILNPLTPWERPPIKNVYCIYGIDLKTEVGYHFAPNGNTYPDNWIITDVIYETEGGSLQSRSGTKVKGNYRHVASGDNTVSYNSLSWCKTWLGSQVNITRTPQGAYDAYDVQEEFNVVHEPQSDVTPTKITRDGRLKYITFYEDGMSNPGHKTAVWELDKADHRNIVRSPVLLRELWLETVHRFHPNAKRAFVSKAKRAPLRDEDCFWDYGRARCSLPERCEYRYVFGDVHLGQSCRLKASSEQDHLSDYL